MRQPHPQEIQRQAPTPACGVHHALSMMSSTWYLIWKAPGCLVVNCRPLLYMHRPACRYVRQGTFRCSAPFVAYQANTRIHWSSIMHRCVCDVLMRDPGNFSSTLCHRHHLILQRHIPGNELFAIHGLPIQAKFRGLKPVAFAENLHRPCECYSCMNIC